MKGLCHTDNVTEFEDQEAFDEQNKDDDFDDAGDGAPKEDYDTYSGFWSVQKYLSNPPSCFKDVKGFLASVDVIIQGQPVTAACPNHTTCTATVIATTTQTGNKTENKNKGN